MSGDSEIILQAIGISRSFGGVEALSGVDLTVHCGEVHAVVGENGAGKTTLMNILGGIIKQDKGIIEFNGGKINFSSPHEAFKKGISTIHQELTMMPHLSVMENIFMGSMGRQKISAGGIINRNKLRMAALEKLDLIELSVDPRQPVKNLSIPAQQEIEIIKALSGEARLIIMDEPNSSLTDSETKRLFSIIAKLKKQGISIIYVSHKIEEVLQIADRITVLRDGRLAGVLDRSEATGEVLFRMIAGKEKEKQYLHKANNTGKVLLKVNELSGQGFKNISFDLHRGEVLGLYGLVGSGRSELARAVFGDNPATGGSISINDRRVYIDTPAKAIDNRIAMVPEDRKELGLFMDLPVDLNMTISRLHALSRMKFLIRPVRVKNVINEYIRLLNIKMKSPGQKIKTLSGGNQQKVVLARCLMIDPEILILDEPTHGIDVGAKEEIYRLIGRLASEGLGVIFISSEMPEIIAVSDRIAVLHEGSLAAVFERSDVTREKLIACATGYKLQKTQ